MKSVSCESQPEGGAEAGIQGLDGEEHRLRLSRVQQDGLLELKSVRRIITAHEIQLVNCLVATGKPVRLVLNFGERKVEVKRKVRELAEG